MFSRASDSPHCLYSIRMLYTAITQWSLLCPSGSVFFTLWEMRVQHVVALSCPHFSWILGALHIFSAIVQRCIVSNKNIITWQIFRFFMPYILYSIFLSKLVLNHYLLSVISFCSGNFKSSLQVTEHTFTEELIISCVLAVEVLYLNPSVYLLCHYNN